MLLLLLLGIGSCATFVLLLFHLLSRLQKTKLVILYFANWNVYSYFKRKFYTVA